MVNVVPKRASRPQQRYSRPRSTFSDQVFSKVVGIEPSRFSAAFPANRRRQKTHGEGESGRTGRIRGRRIGELNTEITNARTASSQGEKQLACATATSRTNTHAKSQRKRASRAPDPLEELGLLPLETRRSRTEPSPETTSNAHRDPRHLIDAAQVHAINRYDRVAVRFECATPPRIVGELLGRQVKIGIIFDNELFARPAKIGNIVASARRFACTHAQVDTLVHQRAVEPETSQPARKHQAQREHRLAGRSGILLYIRKQSEHFRRTAQPGIRPRKTTDRLQRRYRHALSQTRSPPYALGEAPAKRITRLQRIENRQRQRCLDQAELGGRNVETVGHAGERAFRKRIRRRMRHDIGNGSLVAGRPRQDMDGSLGKGQRVEKMGGTPHRGSSINENIAAEQARRTVRPERPAPPLHCRYAVENEIHAQQGTCAFLLRACRTPAQMPLTLRAAPTQHWREADKDLMRRRPKTSRTPARNRQIPCRLSAKRESRAHPSPSAQPSSLWQPRASFGPQSVIAHACLTQHAPTACLIGGGRIHVTRQSKAPKRCYPRSRRAFSLASVSAGMRSATVFLRATLGVSSRRASS